MILNQFITKFLKRFQSKFIFTLLLITLLYSCTEKSDHKELIFLLTLDTTRADAINYDQNSGQTPNLAELAANGVSFKNAYSLIPITLPSHYSMFYSMTPRMAGVYNNGDKTKIPYPGLAGILKRNGYFTGAVISLGVLKSDFGLNKGFNAYIENFSNGLWYRNAGAVNSDLFKLISKVNRKKAFYWVHYSDPHDPYYQPGYTGEFKLRFNSVDVFKTNSTNSISVSVKVKLHPGRNKLKFLTRIPENFPDEMKKNISGIGIRGFKALSDTNGKNYKIEFNKDWKQRVVKKRFDYVTSNLNAEVSIINTLAAEQEMKLSFIYDMRLFNSYKKTAYLEEVSYMDQKIGELISFLKEKKLLKHSTFVIMGDHAEGFEEYKGHIGHIHYLNKVFMNVPLILSGWGVKHSHVKERLVSTLNIAPTILSIANIKKPRYMIGRSLFHDKKNRTLLFETYRPQAYYNSFAVVEYPYQIIYFPEKTGPDKYEFINLEKDTYGTNNILDSNKTIRNRMIQKVRKMSKICLKNKKKTNKKTEKEENILRSLGYI